MKAIKSKILLFILVVCLSEMGWGQVSITAVGTNFTQNFDGLGTSATASLPEGFRIGADWSTGTTATTLAAGTSGTGVITGSSSGGTYNFANGVTASATDRALGFLNTGSYTSPRSIIYAFTNNTGSTISSLALSFDYEKYRSGGRAFSWTFFHGIPPNFFQPYTDGSRPYSADFNNGTVYNPPLTTSRSFTISGLNISNGTTYYLRWTFTGDGGSTNGQAIGIDNFSITAIASASTYTLTFDGNGNTSGSVPSSGSYSGGASVTLPLNTGSLAKTGYTFSGWNANAAGTGLHYDAGSSYTMPSSNTTLYAEWGVAGVSSYTVSYNANGGTGSQTDANSPYAENSTVTVATNSFTRSGYTFAGWNTASDGSGTSYAPSATFTIGANTTLYAQWNLANVDCGDLFISEYVEGSSNNKYIEIYNPTSASVDLSNYSLRLYTNGSSSISTETTLSGTLAAYGAIVYKNSSATVFTGSAIVASSLNFNGDDAFAIAKNGTNIDIFGRIGEDPGTAWTSGSYNTQDKTLVRKIGVKYGVKTNPSSGFPTLSTEWDVYNSDDVTRLGLHTSECAPSVPEINIKQGATGIVSGGSYDFSDQFVGTVSGAITFTIENTGNSALSLTGTPKLALSGTNAADFSIDQTGTSSSIGAAGSTTFAVTFTPSSTGSRTAIISIANNDSDENPYTITLLGNGIVNTGPSTGVYNWIGVDGGSWAVSSNWSPARTIQSTSDKINISNFNGSIINIPTQEIDKLNISNSKVVLTPSAANNVLSIGGSAGTDFILDASSRLTINSGNAMTISLTGTNLGSVYGEIVISNAGHKIVASSSSTPLTFYSGSTITQAGTGNVFGTTIANSIVFNVGATYVQVSGSNPFVLTAPSSVVTFDPNAKFVIATTATPSLAGRIYPILVVKSGFSISGAGSSALTVGGLIVESGASFNLSGATFDLIITGTTSIAGTITWPSSPSVVQNNGTFNTNSTGTSTYTILNLTNNGICNVYSNILSITGTLLNSGTINIGDKGTLLQGSSAANSGGIYNITRQATNQNDWSFYSSPVSGAPVSNLGNSVYYFYNETAANAYTKGWTPATGILVNGKGYIAFPGCLTFTGVANNGNITTPVTYTSTGDLTADVTASGWNLIGNPYPSAISKSSFATANGSNVTGGTVNIWKTQLGTDNYTSLVTDIPSGQSFFIQVPTGATSISFTNAMRNTANSSITFARSESQEGPKVSLRLDNGRDWQELQVGLNTTATDGYDIAYDANVLNGNPNISFYSGLGAQKLAVQQLGLPISNTKEVPLYYNATKAGSYKISQIGIENPNPNIDVYLKDNLTGVETNLSTTTVVSTSLTSGSDINRFNVVFRQAAVTSNQNQEVATNEWFTSAQYDQLTISFKSTSSTWVGIQVADVMGRPYATLNQGDGSGNVTLATSSYAKGVYLVKVAFANGKVETKKVVIE